MCPNVLLEVSNTLQYDNMQIWAVQLVQGRLGIDTEAKTGTKAFAFRERDDYIESWLFECTLR